MQSSVLTEEAIELHPITVIDHDEPSLSATAPPESLPQEAETYPDGLRFAVLSIGLILGIFMAALDANIIATSIPAITNQFGTVKDVGWYSAAYGITNAALQTTWGKAVS